VGEEIGDGGGGGGDPSVVSCSLAGSLWVFVPVPFSFGS
jgi:hypothetical protein